MSNESQPVNRPPPAQAGPGESIEEITYPTGHPPEEGDIIAWHQREAVLAHPSSFFFISNKFESLDYIKVINQLEVEKEKTQTFHTIIREDCLRIVCFFLAGILTACIGFFVEFSIMELGHLKYSYLGSYIQEHYVGDTLEVANMLALWFLGAIIPIMIGSSLVVFIAPYAAGGGVAQCVGYLNGVRVPRVLSMKGLVVKVFSTICCCISGLAGGKEGPMMHIGAISGGSLPSALPWQIFKSDHERRDLAAAGFGAGIAVAFGAPIGGLLLALEEGVSFWDISLMWKSYLCIVMAYFLSNTFLSFAKGVPGSIDNPELLTFGKISSEITDYELFEIGLFAVVGVIGGLLGALVICVHTYFTIFRRRFVRTKVMKLTESFLVACIVASLSILSVMYNKNCSVRPAMLEGIENTTRNAHQMYCNADEYSDMSLLFFQTQEDPVQMFSVALFATVYFILVCFTMGLSISAGVFVPQIVLGAAWGRIFGMFLHQMLPDAQWAKPSKYAYLGATAQLSGTVGKTFSILVIMVEASASISFSFPLMVVVSVTKYVENYLVMPIYETQMHLMGIPFLPSQPPPLSINIPTSQVMSPPPLKTLPLVPTVNTILQTLQAAGHTGFPIVGKGPKGLKSDMLLGLISRQQLLILLKYKAYKYPPPQTPKQMCQCLDLYLKEARQQLKLEKIYVDPKYFSVQLDLSPYYNPYPYTVREVLPLENTYTLFRSLGLRYIIVINEYNEPVAMVTRKDLAKFHTWNKLGRMGVKEMLVKL